MKQLIDKLQENRTLTKEEFVTLLANMNEENSEYLFEKARDLRHIHFDNKVYTRGLIEFSNYCKNDCYYCGIRAGNQNLERYRLTKEQILECCQIGYDLGFRTYVLQGGEDPYFTDDLFVEIITAIKEGFPDCALTLSLGERDFEAFKRFKEAGADRYLLRHETSNHEHYSKLHPANLTIKQRKNCLLNLKKLGYQVGTGFMVGSPYQTLEDLAEDLLFIHELDPQMVGIGPFLPHSDTKFANEPGGTLEQTLYLIGILRLMIPNANLPSTTALGTVHPLGREKGIKAGANVVMPNLSPVSVRENYMLYDNKICTGDEAAECRHCLEGRMNSIGYKIVAERGDFVPM